jgi:hypothetical protein
MRTGGPLRAAHHTRMLNGIALLLCLTLLVASADPLPPRKADAPGGKAFAARIAGLPLANREEAVRTEFEGGNVPDSWRRFAEIKISRTFAGQEHVAILRVSPDYLSIGHDTDFLRMPLSPATAETLARRLDCTLPTRRLVDEIFRAAPARRIPSPLPPGPEMTTVPAFLRHQELIQTQIISSPPGTLAAGHKKDVVRTPLLTSAPGKVAIYGWHRADGSPIQPLYLGHTAAWVDYSHGIRLVENALLLDGRPSTVAAVLADPVLSELLSDEGPFSAAPVWPDEQITELNLDAGVRAVINAPAAVRNNVPLRLVLYAAPAGNTIEQTFGRPVAAGDDWHFDIQHIAAQTRWLRRQDPSADLAVAVLQCREKSWPAWRKAHDPDHPRIPGIVAAIREKFPARRVEIILSGHSAGGSFVFGYLDAHPSIPAEITRIAFLDSNYAYSAAKGHPDKLAAWLRGDQARRLCVFAYHDSHALLHGKSFVSESGGTWGRSHAMLRELPLTFASVNARGLQRHTTLDGRAQILLRENPTREVLHTRLVEWNGFIHSMLCGTALEEQGYRYLAPRVYNEFIAPSPVTAQ